MHDGEEHIKKHGDPVTQRRKAADEMLASFRLAGMAMSDELQKDIACLARGEITLEHFREQVKTKYLTKKQHD